MKKTLNFQKLYKKTQYLKSSPKKPKLPEFNQNPQTLNPPIQENPEFLRKPPISNA